jgi:hypothetical protein
MKHEMWVATMCLLLSLASIYLRVRSQDVRAAHAVAVREKVCRQFATVAKTRADSLQALKDCAAWGVAAPYDVVVKR